MIGICLNLSDNTLYLCYDLICHLSLTFFFFNLTEGKTKTQKG